MKKLSIEWKHYSKKGETCLRCNNTGRNIKEALGDIADNPNYKDVDVSYKETRLGAKKMSESNMVLINNKPIEEILNADVSENYCHSCSCLSGKDTNCRTIKISKDTIEEIPKDLILKVIEKELSIN